MPMLDQGIQGMGYRVKGLGLPLLDQGIQGMGRWVKGVGFVATDKSWDFGGVPTSLGFRFNGNQGVGGVPTKAPWESMPGFFVRFHGLVKGELLK